MPNIERLKKYNKIHMVGIGGVSMSGIAEILVNWGFTVTGSNNVENENTKKLEKAGIKVFIGHNAENVVGSDVVVHTAAVKDDNIELKTAKNLEIPTVERADFLGEITRCFSDTITIAGTHGKSTTTSMVSLCFLEANQDPSIQVGADLSQIDGNYKVGNSEHFIIESCEYVESFLKFSPKSEIILNIDNDHLDYFKTFENVKNAFVKYVKLLPDDGILVVNGDDKNCLDLPQYTHAKALTYGITNKNVDFFAVNIVFDNDGFPEFDVYSHDKFYERIKLHVPGMHNVLNALGCIALCNEYGLNSKDIKNGLAKFTGVGRRFEFKGKVNNASVYDDYGHHPTEIIATAKALMNKKYNESWVVFQPHTYSRTKLLMDDFAKALLNFDNIIVLDIYAARETNTYNVSSQDLADKIKSLGKNAIYIKDFDECVSYLKSHVKENDIVITQGAGTITEIGGKLVQ
ncbi:MAG: UDP-N-acetylmuramate--L-alanine ligase [Clostridia bacterium]|nr:UDP-N-acetylmuramate--L-alanine ligase [Clostridia bacterium]